MSDEAKRLIMQPSKFHPVDQYNEYLTDLVERAMETERRKFSDSGLDHDALNSAVGVLRTQQAQQHKSIQAVLWEAIKDYAERANP